MEDEQVVVASVVPITNPLDLPPQRIMVHSLFRRFKEEAATKFGLPQPVAYVFTAQGGEIESSYDILHNDVLYLSQGEAFALPQPKTVVTVPKAQLKLKPKTKPKLDVTTNPESVPQAERQKLYREHEAAVLQLQSVFPHISLRELLSTLMLANFSLDGALELLLTTPERVVKPSTTHTIASTTTTPQPSIATTTNAAQTTHVTQTATTTPASVARVYATVYVNGEAGVGGLDNGVRVGFPVNASMAEACALAASALHMPKATRVFTLQGGEIKNVSEIEADDEICFSAGEKWKTSPASGLVEDDDDDDDDSDDHSSRHHSSTEDEDGAEDVESEGETEQTKNATTTTTPKTALTPAVVPPAKQQHQQQQHQQRQQQQQPLTVTHIEGLNTTVPQHLVDQLHAMLPQLSQDAIRHALLAYDKNIERAIAHLLGD
eukprot:TRINITY_DN4557_c0_g1_i1.p1 TRINITY_DN4557_c0_g1~~TRINITY_DN4557_c0_g1_i1.p1  ORF type:complete len:442 (+),score=111.58 TRINITY_DN4557_c0_g1_i1:26-1327(+)